MRRARPWSRQVILAPQAGIRSQTSRTGDDGKQHAIHGFPGTDGSLVLFEPKDAVSGECGVIGYFADGQDSDGSEGGSQAEERPRLIPIQ